MGKTQFLAVVFTALALGLFAAAAGAQPGGPAAGRWIEWDDKQPQTFNIEGFRIELSKRAIGDEIHQPKVRVRAPNGKTFAFDGVENMASLWVGVAKLDRASPYSQVLVLTSTRGNYCCQEVDVLDYVGDRWRRIRFTGQMYNNIAFPKDHDGDGRAELILAEKAFLNAFTDGPYHDAPPIVLRIDNGGAVNVSHEGQFRPAFEGSLGEFRELCEKEHVNGACANYVASAIRAGQGDAAWDLAMKAYDREGQSDLIFCRTQTAQCPAGGTIQFKAFPEALRWFLNRQGYQPIPKAADAFRAPS